MTTEELASIESQLNLMNARDLRATVSALLVALQERKRGEERACKEAQASLDSLDSLNQTLDYYTRMGVGRGY